MRIKQIIRRFLSWIGATAMLLALVGCDNSANKASFKPIPLDTAQMMETAASEMPVKNSITLRERLDAQEKFQYKEKNGIVTLSINAPVLVPEVAAVSVVRTTGADFSQEQVDQVLALLWGKDAMWDNNPPLTKVQIEEQIASIEENLNTQQDYQDEREYFETLRLPELREKLRIAPETASPVSSDGKLTQQEILDAKTDKVAARMMQLSVRGESGQYFSVNNNNDNTAVLEHTRNGRLRVSKWAQMRYQRDQNHGAYLTQMILPTAFSVSPDDTAVPQMPNTTIVQSPADAAGIVRRFLAALGEDVSIRDQFVFDDAGQGAYLIRCVRNVQGIPVILMDGESTALYWDSDDEEKPDAVWANETITLVVNQEGILQFGWESPHQIGETLVEDCTLLPFTDVMEVAVKMLPLLFDEHWGHIEDMTSANIQITQIEFGMMRIIKNQSIDEGLMLPVWAFYGAEPFESASLGSQNQPRKQTQRLLTINAIDGTIVDPVD